MLHSNALLNDVLQRISKRKGKMLRPLLTLLSAKLLGEVGQETISTALTFEFFHTASLVHDDVVDESDERRGETSVNSAYSNKVAVLVGDYLLANCLQTSAASSSLELVNIVSRTAQVLADGELLQLRSVFNQDISEEVYFHIIRAKTAALFSACAEAGARSVGAPEADVERMRRFGESIGICFQIKDDIFDYVGGAEIGKPTGNDMAEGKLTLPVIHVLHAERDESMFRLAQRIKNGRVSSDEIDTLVRFTIEHGGIEYAVRKMEYYAAQARQVLAPYPDGSVRRALLEYVDYVIRRTF